MTPERREIIRALEEMSEIYPHWRFGQLVVNISCWAKGATAEAVWDVEDEEFLRGVKSHLEQGKKRVDLVTAQSNSVPGSEKAEKVEFREVNVLPPEIWRQYEGKVIVFSEDEQRVIGVGDTDDEAFDQAEASGVEGIWHIHHAARWDEERI